MVSWARNADYRAARTVPGFFYSNEGREPAHVHIERDDSEAKFWLDPVDLADGGYFRAHELTELRDLVIEHQIEWLEKWHEWH